MFHLELTQKLAESSFNAMVLNAMERDALNLAALRLQNQGKGAPLNAEELLQEANNLLPTRNDSEALRLFFATQHQIHDTLFDNNKDLATFISKRAAHVEMRADEALKDSQSPGQWINSLSHLASGYSFVLEAAEQLKDLGLIALRRMPELQALSTRPDEDKNYAGAMLFDKASALLEVRRNIDKHHLNEAYR